ncbi:MAG: metallophosphoesterase [Spirochaetales bacterium]|nr:metallophosphoesterase [Spirochaetales bacterium]
MSIRLKGVVPFICLILFFSCASKQEYTILEKTSKTFPDCRFLVMTDPHYLSGDLFNEGKAFNNHLLWKKGNLTGQGAEILAGFAEKAASEAPDFIIVPGDLTNDGERQSHIDLARYFKLLEEEGTEVFVIPGNHDIDHPYARSFLGDRAYPTESLSAGEFLTLYEDFGYNQALNRDLYSLSYTARPVEGLTILGLDSCVYGEGYGYIRDETMVWLKTELHQAAARGDALILYMHHPLLDHFPGQGKEKEMALKNREELRELLQAYGVNLVFTGHYHAQDIVSHQSYDETIFDVETGALISWPFAYRLLEAGGSTITITGKSLEDNILEGEGRRLSYESIYRFSNTFLARYKVNKKDREAISDYVSNVLLNHYGGNENRADQPEKPKGLSLWGKLALRAGKKYYEGRMTDLPPDDRSIEIDLRTGEWTPLP